MSTWVVSSRNPAPASRWTRSDASVHKNRLSGIARSLRFRCRPFVCGLRVEPRKTDCSAAAVSSLLVTVSRRGQDGHLPARSAWHR